MYKLKIDMLFREPIVLEFEDRDDAYYTRCEIERCMNRAKISNLIHLNSEHGYQGRMTINPTYIRAVEEVEE